MPILVGVIIGVALMSAALAYRRVTGRSRPAVLQSTDSVNVFEGTVFPAPHDARWRRVEARDGSGSDVFVFGDRNIRLSSQALSVDEVVVFGRTQVAQYFSDVQRCYYAFKQTLALQSVDSAVLNAGFGKDEVKSAIVCTGPEAGTYQCAIAAAWCARTARPLPEWAVAQQRQQQAAIEAARWQQNATMGATGLAGLANADAQWERKDRGQS